MTVDYDAPRRTAVDSDDESLAELAGHRGPSAAVLDVDDVESTDSYDLPDTDLSGEELIVRVLPRQHDEFTCSRCFLVCHRTRLASGRNGHSICVDCA